MRARRRTETIKLAIDFIRGDRLYGRQATTKWSTDRRRIGCEIYLFLFFCVIYVERVRISLWIVFTVWRYSFPLRLSIDTGKWICMYWSSVVRLRVCGTTDVYDRGSCVDTNATHSRHKFMKRTVWSHLFAAWKMEMSGNPLVLRQQHSPGAINKWNNCFCQSVATHFTSFSMNHTRRHRHPHPGHHKNW